MAGVRRGRPHSMPNFLRRGFTPEAREVHEGLHVGVGLGAPHGTHGHVYDGAFVADVRDAAVLHREDGLREPLGFVGGMRDVEDGNARDFGNALEVAEKLGLALRVETRERLVHDEERLGGENAAPERDALAFAARERVGTT